jgi:hypothetical protein
LICCIEAHFCLGRVAGKGRYDAIVGSESWVIVCGWAGGGEAIVDLKEINAGYGSGFGRMGVFSTLSALSFQLLALLSCIEAHSAPAERRAEYSEFCHPI